MRGSHVVLEGAAPYTDTTAGVEYMVYNRNQWVSYDSATTFEAKIDYANEMGLAGLMVWAIDQDDPNLTALKAITDKSTLNSSAADFSLVPLEYLFPNGYVPANDSTINYGLVNFGGQASGGSTDPSKTGFGFMLVAGDSFAVSNHKRQAGAPEPFVFIDCPVKEAEHDTSTVHTARVVCLSDDLHGCFQVLERGIEGTVVTMPDNCFGDSIARAISLELATDQFIPENPGIQSSEASDLMKRYFAPEWYDWESQLGSSLYENFGHGDTSVISEDMSAALLWDKTGMGQCDVDGEKYTEGIAAWVDGRVDAEFTYGFTLIVYVASSDPVRLFPVQSGGFLNLVGQTDLTHGVAGMGTLDISQANLGNPAIKESSYHHFDGATVPVGSGGSYLSVSPYYKLAYHLGTETEPGSLTNGDGIPFNGRLETRTITDFGNFTIYYPVHQDEENHEGFTDDRRLNEITIPDTNIMYGASEEGGQIAIGSRIQFGVQIGMGWSVANTLNSKELIDQSPDEEALCYASQDTSDKEATARDSLALRQSGGDFPWNWKPDTDLDIGDLVPDEVDVFLEGKFAMACAGSCIACAVKRKDNFCCGCLCLRCVYAFGDIDRCPECDAIPSNPSWPGESVRLKKKSNAIQDAQSLPSDDLEISEDSKESEVHHELWERARGDITRSEKKVTFCGNTAISVGGDFRYPAFPSDATWPWENLGYDLVDRYYGNASASCGDWSIIQKQTHDMLYTASNYIRADYQTEHVFVGQLIGDFFKVWLATGRIKNQPVLLTTQANILGCDWTEEYIQNFDPSFQPWYLPDDPDTEVTFAQLLVAELGSMFYMGRLAILMSRPNRMKGALFAGNRAISPEPASMYHTLMTPEAQLLAVKDFGMVFNYMNNVNIWDKFCRTFEGIYTHMDDFDSWYSGQVLHNDAPDHGVSLADEWAKFIRVTLDSMVLRSRILFQILKDTRIGKGSATHWEDIWTSIQMTANENVFQLPRTCAHLAGSAV
ncbi:hypothetical protein F5Y15DRAFT_423445 [Xylariaceae sp. FL0016]|nr:hypothetical protein F5Y15DRAFT_423445 [Xylariaceae sp. FL0016]